jgi:hypothetical protein
LILLADGHMVYNGSPQKVVAYFAKLGYKCPQYTNPAEYIRMSSSSSSSSSIMATFITRRLCSTNTH